MFRMFATAAFTGAFALAGVAVAGETAQAQLSSVKGAVVVNQGGKFAPGKTGALRAGDRVVAQDGEARLTYPDGCVVTLQPRSMTTIGEASPCVQGPGLVTSGPSAAQFSDMTPLQGVMAVLAIGGLLYGVGSLIDNASNDDDVPVSP